MNIIILPLYGIGDVLMTTPAIRILKNKLKDAKVTCLCMFRNTLDVLQNNPDIDSLLYYDFVGKRDFQAFSFLYALRGKFDCSINFYPSNRREYNILSFLIGAKKRIGHRYLHSDLTELNFLKTHAVMEETKLHNVEENVKLLKFIGIKSDDIPPMKVYLTAEETLKGKEYITSSEGVKKIGIHAGTSVFKGHAGKRWPVHNFSALIDRCDGYDFYLFGGPDDRDVNEEIIKQLRAPERARRIEGLPIRLAASVMKNLDLFLSNDSGLMHLAAAAGIPVVGIFGPTDPDALRPWGIRNKPVKTGLSCSPCFYYSPKPLECRSEKKFRCLSELSADSVYDAVCEMLRGMPVKP